jgi:hypothetical protein
MEPGASTRHPRRITKRRPTMDAQSPITNSLRPPKRHSWIAPLKFRRKAFLRFSLSLDESLAELEARYPSPRPAVVSDRRARLFERRPQ